MVELILSNDVCVQQNDFIVFEVVICAFTIDVLKLKAVFFFGEGGGIKARQMDLLHLPRTNRWYLLIVLRWGSILVKQPMNLKCLSDLSAC